MINDENQSLRIRHKLLGQPTSRQSQVASNRATADIDNEQQTNGQVIQPTTTTTTTTNKPGIHEKTFFPSFIQCFLWEHPYIYVRMRMCIEKKEEKERYREK